jgi:hypothetical protein
VILPAHRFSDCGEIATVERNVLTVPPAFNLVGHLQDTEPWEWRRAGSLQSPIGDYMRGKSETFDQARI